MAVLVCGRLILSHAVAAGTFACFRDDPFTYWPIIRLCIAIRSSMTQQILPYYKYPSIHSTSQLIAFKPASTCYKTLTLHDRSPTIMSKARSLVDEKIAGKKVVMFSKSYCPYCKTAKSILSGYDLTPEEYEVIELDLPPYDANMDAMQNYLKEKTGARSVCTCIFCLFVVLHRYLWCLIRILGE